MYPAVPSRGPVAANKALLAINKAQEMGGYRPVHSTHNYVPASQIIGVTDTILTIGQPEAGAPHP